MTTPTVNVTIQLNAVDRSPRVGVPVRIRLDRPEIYDGLIVNTEVEGQTDENGTLVLALFPNAPEPVGLGTQGSIYRVSILDDGAVLNLKAQVPNADGRLDTMLVTEDDRLPSLDGAQTALLQAQAAATEASGDAIVAEGHAQAAAASVTEAQEHAAAASGSVTAAAGHVTAAQGHASAAAGSATQAQGYATAADQSRSLAQDAAAAAQAAADEAASNSGLDVLGKTLTGLSTASGAAVTAADTILSGMGKLQRQASDLGAGKLDAAHSGSGGDAHAAVVADGASGFMTGADKTKLDGIATGANNYTHPTGDGNLHVPATGTTNSGRVLTAGGAAGSLSWVPLTKSSVGLNNVDNTSDANKPVSTAQSAAIALKASAANGTHTGIATFETIRPNSLQEKRQNLGAATAIDLLAANLFAKTITGATTFTVTSTPPSGTVGCFLLELTNGGAFAITWWANMKWVGGSAPTLTAAGRDVLGFYTHDNGTTWTGLVLGKDVK